jgi:hypothetical protein
VEARAAAEARPESTGETEIAEEVMPPLTDSGIIAPHGSNLATHASADAESVGTESAAHDEASAPDAMADADPVGSMRAATAVGSSSEAGAFSPPSAEEQPI